MSKKNWVRNLYYSTCYIRELYKFKYMLSNWFVFFYRTCYIVITALFVIISKYINCIKLQLPSKSKLIVSIIYNNKSCFNQYYIYEIYHEDGNALYKCYKHFNLTNFIPENVHRSMSWGVSSVCSQAYVVRTHLTLNPGVLRKPKTNSFSALY